MTKQQALDKIAKEIESCKICKVNKTGKAVPGEGNPNSDIMFIGEAPGRQEGETGRPFIGRSGKLLTILIESIGLKREDVYITSPVKYYPGMRPPTQQEIDHGKTHLQKQIETIIPSYLVLLGRVAVKGVLGIDVVMSKVHGTIVVKNQKNHFITYHPAAALRFQKFKTPLQGDFKKLKLLLKKQNKKKN